MTTLWQFAEIDAVWSRLRPLTPYGRAAFERREVVTDLAELNSRYDRVDRMLALLAANPLKADRVRFHLKRIPMLPATGEIASAAAMESSNREHKAIVDAIASRDAARAAATMANHIQQGKARFLAAAADSLED